ncbi:MAG: hypothetical protein J6A16_01085, partial [Oscillospiraceae bacterium]|nr:hypothetical protein [Oscillospiraceae bacterium]
MAVSMNAGFMRSDYMISDAAIPMRMEELEQLEQSAKFSEILGGIGGSKPMDAEPMKADTQQISDVDADDAAVQTAESTDSIQLTGTQPEKQTVMITKSELKQLAEAVIKGEIKLNDLPKELVSEVLLMAIAMMLMGIPEDEIPVLQEDHTFSVTEAEAQAMSQYVSLIVVPKMSGEAAEQQVQIMSVETADTVKTDAKAQTEADIQLPDELMA